ncbi:MAG TPA: hypothetical protein VM120_01140 [Bryobacteraceae bacterium]|nr:hypothetical protein [Bryobacteraceae bacterium]
MAVSLLPAQVTTLRIEVTEGTSAAHVAGKAAYRGFAVRVTGDKGQPVPNAKVTFRLPDKNPSGKFAGGRNVEEVVTDQNGSATVWGIYWNAVPGTALVSITATSGHASAGTIARVKIVAAGTADPPKPAASFELPLEPPKPVPLPPAPKPATVEAVAVPAAVQRPGVVLSRNSGHAEHIPTGRGKWVLIGLGVAGAIGGGFAYRLSRQASSPTTPPELLTARAISLGLPAITVGKP